MENIYDASAIYGILLRLFFHFFIFDLGQGQGLGEDSEGVALSIMILGEPPKVPIYMNFPSSHNISKRGCGTNRLSGTRTE